MQNFYKVFPEWSGVDVSLDRLPSNLPLRLPQLTPDYPPQTYLAGESYAGQYIPYFGDRSFLLLFCLYRLRTIDGLPRTLLHS
jgi:hypothetical protein